VAEGGGEEQVTGHRPAAPAALGGDAGTADVFISYASTDKAAADSICDTLERGGITCWIAPRDVTNSMLVMLAGSSQVAPTFWLDPKNGVQYPIVMQTPQYQVDTLCAPLLFTRRHHDVPAFPASRFWRAVLREIAGR
jgi:hypothetical protein